MIDLDDFKGAWTLSRTVTDAAYGQNGRLVGQATFVPQNTGLLYHEAGALTLASGAIMQAERSYIWLRDGAGIAVRFADGAAFHRFDPVGQAMGSQHHCGADLYNVTYDFSGWPQWSAAWSVVGPRKNYTSISNFNRA